MNIDAFTVFTQQELVCRILDFHNITSKRKPHLNYKCEHRGWVRVKRGTGIAESGMRNLECGIRHAESGIGGKTRNLG